MMVIRLDDIAWIVVHHFLVRLFWDCCKLYLIYKERRHAYIIIWDVSASFQKDLCQICNKLTTIGVTSRYGFAYPSRTHELTTVVLEVRAAQSLDLGAVFCRLLFALLSFFVLPLYCMSFFELRLLATPLIISHLKVVSSNHGHGEGFSQGISVSSTNKTDIHDRP
jgi:hypothetical protein